ncbi:hypothetical protein ACP70R_021856 [Stipagrostis hirtigluma subsp. patula]
MKFLMSSSSVAMGAMFLLHLLLSSANASASPTILPDGDNYNAAAAAAQGWAQRRPHTASRRLLLLRPTAAVATNTFHVDGGHSSAAATTAPGDKAKRDVEFNASKRPAPGTKFNPKQN